MEASTYRIFNFSKKVHFQPFLKGYARWMFKITQRVQIVRYQKPSIIRFGLVKIDAFHILGITIGPKLEKIENREKIFFVFFTCGQNPYYLLYTILYSCLWTGKNGQKWVFLDFDFFYLRGWGIDMTLGKGSFDPKRHPKSLVSISSMSGGKYSHVRFLSFAAVFGRFFVVR